jgi:hypothetical protein
VKTAVPIHTPKEPATAVCSGAEFEKSQKRSSKAAAYLYTYRKLLVRIGAVVLGAVAIAAIATIRNTPEVSVATAVPSQTVTEAEKAEAAVASEPTAAPVTDAAKSTAPLIGDFGFSLGSPDQSIVTPPTMKAEATSSPAAPAVVAEAPRPSPQPSTIRKEFVEVAVQLTIQDGRIAEAHIGNRQPGAEAFEATALHIARQRRYPPGTSRTETLVVRVANQFGSKE